MKISSKSLLTGIATGFLVVLFFLCGTRYGTTPLLISTVFFAITFIAIWPLLTAKKK